MENNNKHLVVFGLILGLSLIISTSLGAFAFYKIRTADTITTTGSAKKSVVSDQVKWASSITRVVKASTIKDGYAKMDTDLKTVKDCIDFAGEINKIVECSGHPVTANAADEDLIQKHQN